MKNGIWGIEVSIDLKECNPDTIRSKSQMKIFLEQICKEIEVKAFGKPIVVNFGDSDRISGFSIVQLIETSLISGHFVEKTNAAYVNIFSCDYFNPVRAAEFTKKFFEAKSMEFICNYRTL